MPENTPIEIATQNDESHTLPAAQPLPEQHLQPIAAPVDNPGVPQPVAPQQQAPQDVVASETNNEAAPPIELTPQQFNAMAPKKKTLTPKQFSSLTKKHGNLESLYRAAPKAKEHIDTLAERIKGDMNSPHNVATAPIKNRSRAEEKIANDYNGDHNRISDLVRNTVVVEKREHIADFIKHAKKYGAYATLHLKGNEEGANGYSGGQAKFMTPHGVKGEIQANTPEMIAAKEPPEIARKMLGDDRFELVKAKFDRAGVPLGQGHKFYETLRSTAPTRKAWKELDAKSREYYDKARTIEEG